MEKIGEFLKNERIEFYAFLPIDAARFINAKKESEIIGMKSIVVFLIPYKTELPENRTVGRFAAPYDYHIYAKELFERFEKMFGECRCYCDNSPIAEKELAAKAGLGIIGDNSLLINEKYGSYVFIGEIFLPYEFKAYTELSDIIHCDSCGICKKSCPCSLDFKNCISLINQTKNITPEMEKIISSAPFKWGCDICQDVCPYNVNAAETPIDYFKTELVPVLTVEAVDEMIRDGSFAKRAYAWRGEKTIKRNLKL